MLTPETINSEATALASETTVLSSATPALNSITAERSDKQRGPLKTKRAESDPAQRLPKPNWIRVKAGSEIGRAHV